MAMAKPAGSNNFLIFVSQKDKAKKNPIVPEDKACRKVAEMKRKIAKEKVSRKLYKNISGDKKMKIFSSVAKHKAAMII